jgi:hypothetical protein
MCAQASSRGRADEFGGRIRDNIETAQAFVKATHGESPSGANTKRAAREYGDRRELDGREPEVRG